LNSTFYPATLKVLLAKADRFRVVYQIIANEGKQAARLDSLSDDFLTSIGTARCCKWKLYYIPPVPLLDVQQRGIACIVLAALAAVQEATHLRASGSSVDSPIYASIFATETREMHVL
jgi:hypothetical protein